MTNKQTQKKYITETSTSKSRILNTISPKTLFVCFFLLVILPLIGYFTLGQSLKLALTGDDWLLLYTIRQTFEVNKNMSYWNINSYLCTYCPPHAYLSLIKYFFGYNPLYYYLLSLITKILASYSIFYLVRNVLKSILAGVFASAFFILSYIGIQTTDWVFNLNHYLGIGIVALFFISYFKMREIANIKNIFTTFLLIVLALVVSPPRMHGLLPLVIIIEPFYFFTSKNIYKLRHLIFIMVLFLVSYKLIFSSGGYGTVGYWDTIKTNFVEYSANIKRGNIEFIFNPIATTGNYIFPDKLFERVNFSSLSLFSKPPYSFFSFIFPIGLISWIITAFIIKSQKIKFKVVAWYSLLIVLWLLFMRYFRLINMNEIPPPKIAYITVGGISFIFTMFMFFILKRNSPKNALMLILGYAWMYTFSIFPWILAPYSFLESWSRYSVQQSAGLSIWTAVLLYTSLNSDYVNKLHKIINIIASLLLVFGYSTMHIFYTQEYIQNLYLHRSESVVNKLWNKIITDVPTIDRGEISIFYLTYDDYYMAEWGLRFGFSSRAAIHYDITTQKNNPFMIYEYCDLLSIADTGEALSKQGIQNHQPVPLDHIYAFDLKKGQLTNTTDTIRNKLKLDILKKEKSKDDSPCI